MIYMRYGRILYVNGLRPKLTSTIMNSYLGYNYLLQIHYYMDVLILL